jgi:trehalose-6-phosphate synthase
MANTLINVSNRLPVAIKNGVMTKSSGGLVAALEGLPKGDYDQKWIGWPGAEIWDKKEQKHIARQLVDEYG